MTEKMTTEKELNERLAKWAGFEILGIIPAHTPPESLWGEIDMSGLWVYPDKTTKREIVFPQSLDSCFKWLVPKLQLEGKVVDIYAHEHKGFTVAILDIINSIPTFSPKHVAERTDDNAALALCRAIEQLIDQEQGAEK